MRWPGQDLNHTVLNCTAPFPSRLLGVAVEQSLHVGWEGDRLVKLVDDQLTYHVGGQILFK